MVALENAAKSVFNSIFWRIRQIKLKIPHQGKAGE